MGEMEAEMHKAQGEIASLSLLVWLEEVDQLLLCIKRWGPKEGKAQCLPLNNLQSSRRARFCAWNKGNQNIRLVSA